MASGTARYKKAHAAGVKGSVLPSGLASMADDDPMIDKAHDAGRSGVGYDDFAAENGVAEPAAPAAPKGSRPSPRSPRAPRRSSSRRTRIPRPSATRPLAPLSAGPRALAGGAAGILVGATFYALLLSVIDYGSDGPKYWFDAKFKNEPAPAAK